MDFKKIHKERRYRDKKRGRKEGRVRDNTE
jgi:hypothetical protein